MDSAEWIGKKMIQDSYHDTMQKIVNLPETDLSRYHATMKTRRIKNGVITSNAEGIEKRTSKDGFHDSLTTNELLQQSKH